MNDLPIPPSEPESNQDDPPSSGPNLVLIYSLMFLAFLVAVGFAVMIVLPFYHRR